MPHALRSPLRRTRLRAVALVERLMLNAGLTLLAFGAERLLDRAFAAEPGAKPRRKPPGFSTGFRGIHK